ncbi:MAG TPA: STAS domain-containing protein [Thermoleophilaceae bacterium]
MTVLIERDSIDKSASIIWLGGDIDLYVAPELKDLIFEAIRAGNTDLVVDLSAVTFIDSTALGVMVQARKRLEPEGGSIRVACPSTAIVEIFEMVGLDRVVPMHESVEDAVMAIRLRRGSAENKPATRSGTRRWLRVLNERGHPV